MLSPHLKQAIEDAGVLLVESDQESILSLPGLYKDRYTCSFKPFRDGRYQLQAWSQPEWIVDVQKVKHLYKQLVPSFGTGAALSYSQETQRFCIAIFSGEKDLTENLTILSDACNFVFPLFYEVARGKDCDNSLLELAKYVPQDMSRA